MMSSLIEDRIGEKWNYFEFQASNTLCNLYYYTAKYADPT